MIAHDLNQVLADRRSAGRLLALLLGAFSRRPDVIVLALPRGGVPVAYEIAIALHLPLDVLNVRKLGVPGHEELAMGAIASWGAYVIDSDLVAQLRVPIDRIQSVVEHERRELDRREVLYRDDRPEPSVTGKIVIVVDDGLATGSTMIAAVRALRTRHPHRVIVAVPVGAYETCDRLSREADGIVCLRTPEPFRAVGLHYVDFSQTTDEEVCALLRDAYERTRSLDRG
jgi:predicted phosphoribosyltransferase